MEIELLVRGVAKDNRSASDGHPIDSTAGWNETLYRHRREFESGGRSIHGDLTAVHVYVEIAVPVECKIVKNWVVVIVAFVFWIPLVYTVIVDP